MLVPETEGAHLQLQNAERVILDLASEESEGSSEKDEEESEAEGEEIAKLQSALNQTLQEKVSSVEPP